MDIPQFRRKNHYVSEGYLKRWAGSDGRVQAYRVLVSHENVRLWRPSSPGGLAYQRHLYTPSGDRTFGPIRFVASRMDCSV